MTMKKYVIFGLAAVIFLLLIASNFWVGYSQKLVGTTTTSSSSVEKNEGSSVDPLIETSTTSTFVEPEVEDDKATASSEEKKEGRIPEETARKFLEAYYTYTEYGDNFSTYEQYLLPAIREKSKQAVEDSKKQANLVTLGYSKFLNCELFISDKSSDTLMIIARTEVRVQQTDTTSDKTDVITSMNDSIVTMKQDTSDSIFYVQKIQSVRIME